MFKFEELDNETRAYMLRFVEEQMAKGPLWPSERFTERGRADYPEKLKEAVSSGNEIALANLLDNAEYWETHELDGRTGRMKKVPYNRHEQFAISEFNTYYVQGLANKLLEAGITKCEIYRADEPKRYGPPCPLIDYEGIPIEIKMVIAGYRRYEWPQPVNPQGIRVPAHTNCHHSIKRVRR